MLAWTWSSTESGGLPEVMAPSKKVPLALLLPSPPVPRMMAPSSFLGLYPGGRFPFHFVSRAPACALPAFSPNAFPEGPLSMAVRKDQLELTEVLLELLLESPSNMPFSRSAATQGPLP